MKDHEIAEKWIDEQIELIDWGDPENEPGDRSCRMCKGSGLAHGDLVPYGMGMVSMPDTICDCVWDRFYAEAEKKFGRFNDTR